MRALVASPGHADWVELREAPEPEPARDEAIVTVKAVSLNRGEVRRLATAPNGWRPGWDIAGVVHTGAANGSGPIAGTRVVGLVRGGGWAERVAVRTTHLAPIPNKVSFATAATLPVAGLTALRTLALGGLLLGQRVLITGAAGGVGRFAVQLAARAGAEVTGVVGSAERAAGLERLGADAVVTRLEDAGAEFDLVLESVGGTSLATALTRVASGTGTVVSFGNSSGEPTTFNASEFYNRSGARLVAFVLFPDLERRPSAARDLAYLASLVEAGELHPEIAGELSWRDPGAALTSLMKRQVRGKAVLRID